MLGRPSGNAINGDLQTVGALGVGDVGRVAGFDIFGTNNLGLAALNVGGAATSDLFTINLRTGAATRVDTIGGGEKVRGLAYGRVPVATVFALTRDNHLVSFKPLTPGTFDTDVAVTGLQGAEAIVGIDFRPCERRAVRASRMRGTSVHGRHDDGRGVGQRDADRQRGGRDGAVHRAVGNAFRRGLQSGRRPAAHPERHRPEPARRRGCGHGHHRRHAESGHAAGGGHGVHQQLRGRDEHDAVRARPRRRARWCGRRR